ncbi:MAG: InlB B-repeat-containing protein [Clostridia bacterium]|nr:InlB B-repeat-containing protein [Clostridia bacterium]
MANKDATGTMVTNALNNLTVAFNGLEVKKDPMFTLVYKAGENGSISGITNQTVGYSKDGTQVTAVANLGYHFVKWSDGATTAERTDVNVKANTTVTAEFAINKYTVTFKDHDGTVLKTEMVEHSEAATALENPNRDGYEFTGWDKEFANVTEDLIITAMYKIAKYKISFSVTPGDATIVVSDSEGNIISIEDDGSHILEYSGVYYYRISAVGYIEKSETIKANKDETITINLEAEAIEVDLTNYNQVLAQASEVDYLTASWNGYQRIVAENHVTVNNSQGEVDEATSRITEAQTYLLEAEVGQKITATGGQVGNEYVIFNYSLWEDVNTEKSGRLYGFLLDKNGDLPYLDRVITGTKFIALDDYVEAFLDCYDAQEAIQNAPALEKGHMFSYKVLAGFDINDEPVLEPIYGSDKMEVIDIQALDDIKVVMGITVEELLPIIPSQIMITLDDGTKRLVAVNWEMSDFNGSVAGNYTIMGELELPTGFLNTKHFEASIAVAVIDNTNGIENVRNAFDDFTAIINNQAPNSSPPNKLTVEYDKDTLTVKFLFSDEAEEMDPLDGLGATGLSTAFMKLAEVPEIWSLSVAGRKVNFKDANGDTLPNEKGSDLWWDCAFFGANLMNRPDTIKDVIGKTQEMKVHCVTEGVDYVMDFVFVFESNQ